MKRTALIVIFPKDSAGIFRGQRLKFFDGDFGHKMSYPYFSPTKCEFTPLLALFRAAFGTNPV